MKKRFYFVIFIAVIMAISLAQMANAGNETTGLIASAKVEKKAELKETAEKSENKAEVKEVEGESAGELEKEGTSEEESEEEEKPAWKFTGWQFLFGVITAGYYAAALKILPLIVEDKKHSGGH